MPTFLSAWSAHSLSAQDTATVRQWHPCAAAAYGCADIVSGAHLRDRCFRASPRSTSLHEASAQVAQILGGFDRNLRARGTFDR
jgi:hypothetical protein